MENQTDTRGIVTMAFGKQPYIEMAKSLGMSIRVNAPDIPSAILTDSSDPELRDFFNYVIPQRPEMGNHVESKLYLDRFSPFEHSLFIDSDCLVVNDLTPLWSCFNGQYFGVPGWRYLTRADKDAVVDVRFVLETFGLDRLAKFNGGCYYFKKSPETTTFFDTARSLLADAGRLKIANFRTGGFCDEPLFALALGIHRLKMTSTGTRGFWTPLKSRGPIHLDLFAKQCHFRKEGMMVYPDIVHFPAGYRECYAYHREVWKLKRHFGKAVPGIFDRMATTLSGFGLMAYRDLRQEVKWMLKPEKGMAVIV